MRILKAASAAVLAVLGTTAASQETRFGAGLSLFGPAIEAQTKIGRNVTVRGIYAGGLNASGTQSADGLDYTLSGSLGGTAAMVAYHLPAGIRFSGGLMFSNSSITGTVTGDGTDFGGPAGAVTVESDVSFVRSTAPITTIGIDIPIFYDFVLSTDTGVVWNGGYNVSLTQTAGTTIPAGDLANAEADIEDELSALGVFPYVSLMVGKWF
ncbi:MAG: hypothetical protein QGI08_05320 [Paracoccaceae bacterium]|nr:hypothetical protein [Paracoccaceae bacterium]MDP7185124.1 hypothetical protein [Paracoccaceae bacterium]